MHEVSLAQGIVDIVSEHARSGAFRRVTVVHVELGALANVLPDALLVGFDAASKGTAAEGARLVYRHTAGQGWCSDCAADIEVASRLALCPRCAGTRWIVTGGEQMRVLELEVD
jgi:hydrogenase nickel incorporation protein HypA/HybF